jgi:hypothetical protein
MHAFPVAIAELAISFCLSPTHVVAVPIFAPACWWHALPAGAAPSLNSMLEIYMYTTSHTPI